MNTTKVKKAKIKVIRRPRHTSEGMIPLRIEEKTIRVARAKVATVKAIIKK